MLLFIIAKHMIYQPPFVPATRSEGSGAGIKDTKKIKMLQQTVLNDHIIVNGKIFIDNNDVNHISSSRTFSRIWCWLKGYKPLISHSKSIQLKKKAL